MPRSPKFAALLVLAATVAGVTTMASPVAAAPASGFVDEIVISGLTLPTDLEFAADGTVFVAEHSGIIKRFASIGSSATTYVDLRPEVLQHAGRGLTGIALDPNYPTSPTVYAFYDLDRSIAPGATIPSYNDSCSGPCPSNARVKRLTGTTTATTQTVLLDGWCQLAEKHTVDDIEVGPDGALYVSAGDAATEQYADTGQTDDPCGDPVGEGGSLRAQDLRTAGDPVGFEGKVLRLDATTGAAAAGNPGAASPDANTRRVLADGLRNPWRLAFRPGSNELYIAENGWNSTEELNTITVGGSTVANFGWPCFEGGAVNAAFAGAPICSALAQASTAAPAFSYQHGQPLFAGSACGAGASSNSAVAFAGPNSYPARLHNALFLGDFARRCIVAVRQGPDGRPDFGAMEDIVIDAARPMDLETGPGGDIYYLDYVGGAVHRIRYTGPANPAPTPAVASVTPSRLHDSRSGDKPTAGSTRTITVAGRGGVPTTGAAAVAITLTGTQPDDLGYLTTWPTGPRPEASNLNLTPGQTAANMAIVPLAPDGTIQLYTSGRTHLIVDVIAWIPTTSALTSLTPSRIHDSRSGDKPTAGSTRTITVAGRGGVPTTGAAAVAITLTGTQPDDLGYLTTWPTGPRPEASNLNLTPGQTAANMAIVPLAPDGTIQLYTSGRTHLIVDVIAWIPTTSALTSLTPSRIHDSRSGDKPTAGSTRTITVAGRGGVPTTGAAAVAITLTGTQPDDLGYLTTWPTGPRPEASNLNLTPGQTAANMAIVPLAPDGTIQLYTSGRTHLIVDVIAWIPAAG